MNLKEYVEKTDFLSGKGLPEGDTYVDIAKTEVEEGEYEGKKTFRLVFPDKNECWVPRTVMGLIKKVAGEGFAFARVTRQGKGKEDTRYTVIGVKTKP